jgi:membrane protease YdiL (CAAX protease family)
MNKKYILHYLVVTFGFSYIIWGCVIGLMKIFALQLVNPLCMGLYLLGSFGPLVGSFLVQKKEARVTGFKEFLKRAFDFKTGLSSYLLVLFFLLLYFLYPLLDNRITLGIPFYIAILLIPVMLFGGGMEETGWRWILEPELEKRLSIPLSAYITSIIWALWHLPLFFMEGSSQASSNFISFFILLIGMSFVQAVLFKHSQKISLSILLHCAFNALQMAFVVKEEIWTSLFMTLLMVLGALLVEFIDKRRMKSQAQVTA